MLTAGTVAAGTATAGTDAGFGFVAAFAFVTALAYSPPGAHLDPSRSVLEATATVSVAFLSETWVASTSLDAGWLHDLLDVGSGGRGGRSTACRAVFKSDNGCL